MDKLYWSDWSGHPNHFGVAHLHNTLTRIKMIRRFTIMGNKRIHTTKDAALIPLSGPRNSAGASPEELADRVEIAFESPVYAEVAALVHLNGRFDIRPIEAKLATTHEILFDSAS